MQSVNMKVDGQWKRWLMPLVFCMLLLMGVGMADGLGTESGVLRSRVYKLRYITSQQAQELLSQFHIGKSYNALTSDVLILTSNVGSDLIKATGIIDILDQSSPASVQVLTTDLQSLPKPDTFIAGLGTLTVGTMAEAPPKGSVKPAIIDVVDNRLVAIASEAILNELTTAFQEWENKNKIAVRENTASEKAAAEPLVQTPREVSLPEPKPEALEPVAIVAEPNLPRLAPEPNKLVEPAAEALPSVKPLEEVAQELLKTEFATDANTLIEKAETDVAELVTEPNEPAAEPSEESPEDFLSEGLLQELADAEQKLTAEQAPAETAVAEAPEAIQPEPNEVEPLLTDADEPAQKETEQDEGMKTIQALLAQAKADEERALAAEKAAAEEAAQSEQAAAQEAVGEKPVPMETDKVQPAEPAKESESLQTELEQLRQKLAELETKAAETPEPAPEPTAESKVQTSESESVQTEPQIAPEIANEELETVMDLPQEVELESLVDLVGKQLGLNYLYDPSLLKNQKVQLKVHGGKIKVKDVYSLLESVLKLKGFAMAREHQLVTIVKAADAVEVYKQVDPVIRTPGEQIEAGNVIVSTLFQLENIDANMAKQMLISLNLGMSNGFQEIPETGTLIVTDYAYRMGRIEEVLSIIDVPGEKKEYKFRTLKYLKPSEVVPKLQELASQLQGVSLQISTSAPAAPQTRTVTTRDPRTGRTITKQVPVATAAPAAAAAPQADAVYIDTDDRTNRILMAGKPDQIALISELVDALDVPQYDLKFVREYLIQNVEAQEVVDVINELGLASVTVTTSKTSSPTAARTTPGGTPTPTPTPAQTSSAAASGTDQPYISIRAASNSLLVNGTAEQHSAIELVIAHVDVIQKDQRTIRQYEIQYVDTQEIMDTLTDLGIIVPQTQSTSTYGSYDRSRSTDPRSRSMTSRSTQPGQPEAAEAAAMVSLPTAEGGSEKEITADQPQISVLEATNSLLVFATPRQHDAIALVIAHADRVPEATTTPYVVYALENQDPTELADVLTQLIQETVEEAEKSSTPESRIQTRPSDQTGTSKVPTLEEQKIRIIPDEMSYSLIVYANKRNQQWISELISELDEYRPQVLLDCTLVEVTKDDEFKYSIDLVAKTYDGTTLQAGTPVGTLGGNFSSTGTLGDASTVGGNITAFLNTGSVQALLTAMQQNGFGRVMSQPKLLVNDNQEGEIKSETKTSIAQQKSIIQPSSDQGQTITTTDVSFNEYTAGVTLTIKPHISKGDMLRLEITLSRSDFKLQPDVVVAGSGYPRPPDILSTDVTSVATVPDGTTIVLGGLEAVTQNKSQTKVPILGDIPLIGTIFRSVDNTDKQSKLYVFVRAHVIRPGNQIEGLEDICRVSTKYRNKFEKMENKFQCQDDFPSWKPKPMDPEKVLEDDEYLQELEKKLDEMDKAKATVEVE